MIVLLGAMLLASTADADIRECDTNDLTHTLACANQGAANCGAMVCAMLRD